MSVGCARLGSPTHIGIGINSGLAFVGNTGSQRKFKYGPLGNSVNVASRVQGATKYLRVDALITDATQNRLSQSTRIRRLCKVRVVNIKEPVNLYELAVDESPDWTKLCADYQAALECFESKDFRKAAGMLSQLILQYPNDGPSLILLSRVVECLVKASDDDFDPVWELPGK